MNLRRLIEMADYESAAFDRLSHTCEEFVAQILRTTCSADSRMHNFIQTSEYVAGALPEVQVYWIVLVGALPSKKEPCSSYKKLLIFSLAHF